MGIGQIDQVGHRTWFYHRSTKLYRCQLSVRCSWQTWHAFMYL